MRGIYLPYLWAADSCHKNPIVLVHHWGHFEPLLSCPTSLMNAPQMPLVDHTLERLPMPFLLDSHIGKEFQLLDRFMSCEYSPKGYLVASYYDCIRHEFSAAMTPKVMIPTNPI